MAVTADEGLQHIADSLPAQRLRPPPLQLPELDCQAGMSDVRSPVSSTGITVDGNSPQEDPRLMLCNPLYSMDSKNISGVPLAPGSDSSFPGSFPEATSSAATAAQPRSTVSLCSSPVGDSAAQLRRRSALLPRLTAQKTWPPQLESFTVASKAPLSETANPTRAAGRHVAAPSEGDSSAWFGAAAARTAGSCVSSPRAAAGPQQIASTSNGAQSDAPILAESVVAPLQPSDCAEVSCHAAENAWGHSDGATSEAAASEALDAASHAGPLPDQVRGKRPWRPRPPPPLSSCASNRPLKSSGPFFPPAARFAPSPSARSAARTFSADAEADAEDQDSLGAAAFGQEQQQQQEQISVASAEADTEWGEEEEDRNGGEAHRMEDCSTPGTMIVKGDEAEPSMSWMAHHEGRHATVLLKDALPLQPQKENSASPEQRQSNSTKLSKSGTEDAPHSQQPRVPVSPLQERNSPDAAARCSQPIVAQSLAAPGSPVARPGSRHLIGPGPLAASSPAIVRAANRLLRSEPAQAAPLQGTYHAESSAVAKVNAEVTLASPLRRSMQWASRSSAGQSSQPLLLYAAVGTSENLPETRLDEWGQARVDEPQTLAMLRSSGILQRDGPLAASGAVALARASAQQPAVSLRRPHPADLEAAERLRASLSSEGGSSSRALSEPTCLARQPPKHLRIKEEEGVLRASGWTQAPSTPKHAPRQSALPDSPLTSTSSGARSAFMQCAILKVSSVSSMVAVSPT